MNVRLSNFELWKVTNKLLLEETHDITVIREATWHQGRDNRKCNLKLLREEINGGLAGEEKKA